MDNNKCEYRRLGLAPDHIDPATMVKYKANFRKCSHCKTYKMQNEYTQEEVKKTSVERLCNACIASGFRAAKTKLATVKRPTVLGPDINSMSIKDMKDELRSRGVSTLCLSNRTDLIYALLNARNQTHKAYGGPPPPLTREYILSMDDVDLREELEKRNCMVSGHRATLQRRLANASGVVLEPAAPRVMRVMQRC